MTTSSEYLKVPMGTVGIIKSIIVPFGWSHGHAWVELDGGYEYPISFRLLIKVEETKDGKDNSDQAIVGDVE